MNDRRQPINADDLIFKTFFEGDAALEQAARTVVLRVAVGHRVFEMRKRHSLTQKELAERSGLTQPAIARIENGSGAFPSIPTLDRIARAVGETLDITIGITDHPSATDTPTASSTTSKEYYSQITTCRSAALTQRVQPTASADCGARVQWALPQ